MFTPRKLLVSVFALVLAACAGSSTPRYPSRPSTGQYAMGERRLTGTELAKDKVVLSRSFEAVAETTSVSSGQADREEALAPEGAPTPPPAPVAQFHQAGAPPVEPAPRPPPAPEGGQRPPRSPAIADAAIEQMLIYTASLTMAIYQVEQGLAAVERIARECSGYLSARTDVAITIRVPRAKFETALRAIEGSGNVLHRDIKVEDVTDEFFDTEVRVRNARAMRDRLAKLLQQAAVKEALEIEKELARVTQEIELLEGKLKLLQHRVAYSTINVAFQPRGIAIDNRPTRLPFPWLDTLGLQNLMQLEEARSH
jgi:hypothetical protein